MERGKCVNTELPSPRMGQCAVYRAEPEAELLPAKGFMFSRDPLPSSLIPFDPLRRLTGPLRVLVPVRRGSKGVEGDRRRSGFSVIGPLRHHICSIMCAC